MYKCRFARLATYSTRFLCWQKPVHAFTLHDQKCSSCFCVWSLTPCIFSSLLVLASLVFSSFICLSLLPCLVLHNGCTQVSDAGLLACFVDYVKHTSFSFTPLKIHYVLTFLPLLYYQCQYGSVWGSFCPLSRGLFQPLC